MTIGGNGFNTYGAVRVAGVQADLLAPIGVGPMATLIAKHFKASAIDTLIKDDDVDNGWDITLLEPDGERSFISFLVVDQTWSPDWFVDLDLRDYAYIYLSDYELERPENAQIILDFLDQRPALTPIVFDASPRIAHLNPRVMQRLLQPNVIITANQAEMDVVIIA